MMGTPESIKQLKKLIQNGTSEQVRESWFWIMVQKSLFRSGL